MINITKVALIATVILLLSGCSKKVTQQIIDVNNPAIDKIDNVSGSTNMSTFFQADWSSFKSGGNAEIGASGKSLNSSMQMRMHRGKSIYISMRPIMGIEVAKMVISGDSILLVDKVHKRYILEKASLLTNGVPVTVDILQDIFLGRAFELGKGSLTQDIKDDFMIEQSSDGKVLLKPIEQYKGFEYNFVYDSHNNIVSLDVTPSKQGSSTYSVTYGDVRGTVAGKVAGEVAVSTVINGKKFNLNLEYKDIKFNESFTIDTKTPNKYKRVEGKDIMQMFSSGK